MLLDTPGTLRPMLRLSMPVLAEQVLHLLVGFTDMWLTGNLLGDDAYVAAMALMIYALWLIAESIRFVGARGHRDDGPVRRPVTGHWPTA